MRVLLSSIMGDKEVAKSSNSGLALGNEATLAELTDTSLRPDSASEPISPAALDFQPLQPLTLDKDVFATVLEAHGLILF